MYNYSSIKKKTFNKGSKKKQKMQTNFSFSKLTNETFLKFYIIKMILQKDST